MKPERTIQAKRRYLIKNERHQPTASQTAVPQVQPKPRGSVLDAKASSYLPCGTYADCRSKYRAAGQVPHFSQILRTNLGICPVFQKSAPHTKTFQSPSYEYFMNIRATPRKYSHFRYSQTCRLMQIYHFVTNQSKKISVAIDNNHGMVYNLYEKNPAGRSLPPGGQAGLGNHGTSDRFRKGRRRQIHHRAWHGVVPLPRSACPPFGRGCVLAQSRRVLRRLPDVSSGRCARWAVRYGAGCSVPLFTGIRLNRRHAL